VKLVRASPEAVILNLAEIERERFAQILGLYPVLPPAYQPLSRSLPVGSAGEEQRLLDDALAEQRDALRGQIQKWLRTGNRFRQVTAGFNFTLLRADAEWLLQVLNDIRVGQWLLLGAPEEMPHADDVKTLRPELRRAWVTMELSGMFQVQILRALEADTPD
jgi:hypothetical protein